MRIVHLAAGAGQMHCGACAHDAALIRGFVRRGHDALVVPLYTPLRLEGDEPLPTSRIFLGGINAYLQQQFALFRHTPAVVDALFDRPGLLAWAGKFSVKTNPRDLGPMTVSVLQGREGRQRKEVEKLLDFLAGQPRPDVVSITNTLLSGVAPAVKERLGVPVACAVQGEEGFVAGLPQPFRDRARELMRRNVRSVDRILAPSQAYAEMMRDFLDLPAEKVRVVGTGIDAAPFAPSGPRARTPFVIGYLSVIARPKGLDLLAEAFVRLERDAVLRVAGKALNAGYSAEARRAVERAGLGARFEPAGEVDLRGKAEFLRGCSAFCVPSRIAESRGVAVMEAMAAGVPVAAPRAGVFPELVEGTGGGLLFEPEDVDGIVGALRRLIDSPEEADQMGRAGLSAVRSTYSAESMVERTLAAFAGLGQ